MRPDYSLSSLETFMGFVGDKGLASRSTVQGWRVAVGKILSDLEEAEGADVRSADIEGAMRRFANRHPGQLTPRSLAEYRRRVTQAIGEFVAWMDNPAGYKPSGRSDGRKKGSDRSRYVATKSSRGAAERAPLFPPSGHPAGALTLSFPLRSDFLAQVTLPRDISVDEARRLGAFVLTLAADYKPAS